MRTCGRCRVIKDEDEYAPASKSYCRQCQSEYGYEWRQKNKEKLYAYSLTTRRDINYRKKYGILSSDFEKILFEQGGACAICDEIPERTLLVDHDHGSGKIRGLLCVRCNFLVGYARDSSKILKKAANYLSGRQTVPD